MALLCFVLLLMNCGKDVDPSGSQSQSPPNILLIIADDMGKDATNGYAEGSSKPTTPHLDSLMATGLSFKNLWVNPVCTPTRASIITGKYGYRTGIKWVDDVLDPSEKTLQKFIADETSNVYASAIVGKWHLSGNDNSINPESFGLDYYTGLLRGGVQDYYDWQLTEDGIRTTQTEYITSVFTNLAIDWINDQVKPWFMWLAYNAPHLPFHAPPEEMHSRGNLAQYEDGSEPLPYYLAAIEAMDFQIGRLLDSISQEALSNTVIIFLGDNGTPNQVAQPPYTNRKVKGSLYQGGINVPMFISGRDVTRTGDVDDLICSTDLFCTIAALAGVEVEEMHDSKSFKGLLNQETGHRDYQYAEMDDGMDNLWTISDGTYKLLVGANGTEEMYNLTIDPYENDDLLNGTLTDPEVIVKAALESKLQEIRN